MLYSYNSLDEHINLHLLLKPTFKKCIIKYNLNLYHSILYDSSRICVVIKDLVCRSIISGCTNSFVRVGSKFIYKKHFCFSLIIDDYWKGHYNIYF